MTERVNTHKPYCCVGCGAPVKRRVKRCPECANEALRNRETYERTDKHKQEMSERLKGISRPKGWKHSEETKAKISAAWTQEKREAARQRGKDMATDRKWRLRIAKALSGENNPRWKGGIAKASYAPGFSKTLKAQIRELDNYTCQLCGITEDELGYTLSIHHADYDKGNHSGDNLFATCKRCNSLVNTNRDIWVGYFIALAERRQFGKDINHLIGRKIVSQCEGFITVEHLDGGNNAT